MDVREAVLDYANHFAIAVDKGKDIPTFKDFAAAELAAEKKGEQKHPPAEKEQKETSQNTQDSGLIKNAIAALKNGNLSDKHSHHDVAETTVPPVPVGGSSRARV